MFKFSRLLFAAVIVCILAFCLTGCIEGEKPENIKTENSTSNTVSVSGEDRNSSENEQSGDTVLSDPDSSSCSEISGQGEVSSSKAEIIITPDSSSKAEAVIMPDNSSKETETDSALDTDEASSEESSDDDTIASSGNHWDSDGDGYYDIKIHQDYS